jgi:hypothetical protein
MFEQWRPVPKPSHSRGSKTVKQRGEVSAKVRAQLHERSGGNCERCGKHDNLQAAHIRRRWQLKETTVNDLLHLCLTCHTWADQTKDGRDYLKQMEQEMRK